MATVKITKDAYEVGVLYQWDNNQTLTIGGLALDEAPEVHFAHPNAEKAIVRQGELDSNGVVSVGVPNVLLEKPYPINVYVCHNGGAEFWTINQFMVPVVGRAKPSDWAFVDEVEVFSLNALKAEIQPISGLEPPKVEKILSDDGTWTLRFSLPAGVNGKTYVPSINFDGILSWELVEMQAGPQVWPIPPDVSVVGPEGPSGPPGGYYTPDVNDKGWLGWKSVGITRPDPIPSVNIVNMVLDALGVTDPDNPNPEIRPGDPGENGWTYLPTLTEDGTLSFEAVQLDDGPALVLPVNIRGPAGKNGKDGKDGEMGPAGPAGPQGPRGVQGMQGAPGVTGATGPVGPQGPPYELTDEDKAEIVEAVRAADQAEPVPWTQVSGKPFHSVMSNTLVWDGDLTGKEQAWESLYIKLSDVVLTEEDLSGGGRIVLSGWPDDAPAWVGITSDVTEWSDLSGINFIPDVGGTILPPGGGYAGLPIAMMISQDYTLEDGGKTYLLTPGIYVFRVGMFYADAHVSEFTVNNFNGFEREVIKKSALPDDVTLRTDETLRYENGVLGVNTALDAEQDNTLPITSAAVYETLGNIELLLGTI